MNIPLLRMGYVTIAVSLFVGTAFMVVPVILTWIGAIVCLLVAGFFVCGTVKAVAVADMVVGVGEKVEQKTCFMKTTVVEMENIMARATTVEIRNEVKKVYEALRYSDYMSCPELIKIEVHIEDHIAQLKIAVTNEDFEMVQAENSPILIYHTYRKKSSNIQKLQTININKYKGEKL